VKKIFASPVIAVLILVVLASVVFASPTAAKEALPFKGSIEATETQQINFPNMNVSGSGSGNATHLGLLEVSYEGVVYLPTRTGTVSAQFIAANGDSINAEGSGQGAPTGTPNVNMVTESYTITGGSGRFAGATGSFTLVRLINIVTGEVSGSFDGNIVLQ
jgi:hypothetical protein